MSEGCSKMYVGNCSKFPLIKSNISGTTELPEFLHRMDQGFSIILDSYLLPVFTIGTEKVLEQFKKSICE